MEKFIEANQLPVKKIENYLKLSCKTNCLAGLGCLIMPLIDVKNELQSGDLQIIRTNYFPIISNCYMI